MLVLCLLQLAFQKKNDASGVKFKFEYEFVSGVLKEC